MTTLDDAIALAYVSGGMSQLDKDKAAQKADRMAQAKRQWASQATGSTSMYTGTPPASAPSEPTPKSLNASQNERLKALRHRHLQQGRSVQPQGPYCPWNASSSSSFTSSHNRAASAFSERSSSSTHSGLSMASPDSAVSATFDGIDFSEDEALENKYRSLQQDLDELSWVDNEDKPIQPPLRVSSRRSNFDHQHLSASEGHSDNLVRFTAKGIMWIGPETDEHEPSGSAQSHRATPSISSAVSTASTQSVNSLYTVQDVSYMYSEERVQIRREENEFEWVDLLQGGFCGEKAGRPVMKRMVW